MATKPPAADNSILVFTLHSLSNAHNYAAAVRTAAQRSSSAVTIIVFSNLFDSGSGLSYTHSWDAIHQVLSLLYVEASRVSQNAGNVLLRIDVLLKGFDAPVELDSDIRYTQVFRIEGDGTRYPLPEWTETLPTISLPIDGAHSERDHGLEQTNADFSAYPSTYPVVALGGTFDHLHPGHKILLSMAALIAHEKIIVGVTDDTLLQRKANKEFMEPISARMEGVRAFLKVFRPGLIYEVVPIHDVYGPTAVDANIQALVVSKETMKGASSIASFREEKGLPPLRCFVIGVISAESVDVDGEDMEALLKTKLSSTFIREWIAKHESKCARGR